MNRPKSPIEEMGDRCLRVVRDHANATEPSLRMLADFAWAMGCEMEVRLVAKDDAEGAEA